MRKRIQLGLVTVLLATCGAAWLYFHGGELPERANAPQSSSSLAQVGQQPANGMFAVKAYTDDKTAEVSHTLSDKFKRAGRAGRNAVIKQALSDPEHGGLRYWMQFASPCEAFQSKRQDLEGGKGLFPASNNLSSEQREAVKHFPVLCQDAGTYLSAADSTMAKELIGRDPLQKLERLGHPLSSKDYYDVLPRQEWDPYILARFAGILDMPKVSDPAASEMIEDALGYVQAISGCSILGACDPAEEPGQLLRCLVDPKRCIAMHEHTWRDVYKNWLADDVLAKSEQAASQITQCALDQDADCIIRIRQGLMSDVGQSGKQ